MIERVAYLSMHTSPLMQPGVGNAGGMNVYIDELARTMVGRGVAVDVFTRRTDPALADLVEVDDSYRVFHVDAGPPAPASIGDMVDWVQEFAEGVMSVLDVDPPDLVHSHYWLSGSAGLVVKRKLGIPLANSFHTLGRVKDLAKRSDEAPESAARIAAEMEVIAESDCVVAATPLEAQELMEHYGADPARLCTSPPGIDHEVFSPGDRTKARRAVGWHLDGTHAVVAGRIQPLKGVDVALEAASIIAARIPGFRLSVIGGASGPSGEAEVERLAARAGEPDLAGVVDFHDAVPHAELAEFYRAADVVMVPSRSESFGLVAAEAQSCGVPVVAARVGGLEHVVADGRSGILVDGWDPKDHAEAVISVLSDPELSARLSAGALLWSERFSWDSTANRFLELYEGAVNRAERS
jgi:D-inositol-3-phosphate glycosyltransferase